MRAGNVIFWFASVGLVGVAALLSSGARLKNEALRAALRVRPPVIVPSPSNDDAEEEARLTSEVDRLRAEVKERQLASVRSLGGALAAMNPGAAPTWTNSGSASPRATVQTVLWAVEAGSPADLAPLLAFDADAGRAADQFFAALPAGMQAEFQDAGHLVATMMAARTPVKFAVAEMLGETPAGSDESIVRMKLGVLPQYAREVSLRCRRNSAGWQILVPAEIIEGYRSILIGTPTP
jgi:hypothetical protein